MALLVGYGTLLYRPSLGDTIGGATASAIEMVPVVVAGYQRLFNLRPDHYVPLTSSVLDTTGIENAAMNVEPAPGFNVNGLAFAVDDAQLPGLDRRERDYRRSRVQLRHFDTDESVGDGWIYSSEPDARWIERDPEAVESYHAAEALYEATSSASGKADILNKLGSVEFNSGHHRDAITLFLQALELHREVGNRSMEAEDLNDMGAAHRYLEEPERALEKFKDSLELHLLLGNRRLESITRCNVAGTLCDLERFQEGLSEAVHAKGIAEEVNAPIPLIWAHCWEARALRGLGDRAPAEERLREALVLSRSQDNPRGLAGVLGMLGDLLGSRKSRREEAVMLLREALAVMEAAALDQAFGGQRRAAIKELLDRLDT
ncbi:MAG TPA: tetratricopeptide repeat protein [Acidobacteria bacterium]|nr:tetratricopeptide repeat protein [Acidobacteriota bacterium]